MNSTAKFYWREFGKNNSKVIFLLGGWKTQQSLYWLPARLFALRGYRCIVYTYESSVLSPDIERTDASLHAIRDAVLLHIQNLKKEGLQDFSLFGYSLGTLLSCMVANKSADVSRVILNMASASLARSVWLWDDIAPDFKKAIQDQDYTQQMLERAWRKVDPVNNVDNMSGKRVLVYLATRDRMIPFTEGDKLVGAIRSKADECLLVINRRGGHAVSGVLNLLRIRQNNQFLR